jgi:uncharacterized ubiquitin-like protein YukD
LILSLKTQDSGKEIETEYRLILFFY